MNADLVSSNLDLIEILLRRRGYYGRSRDHWLMDDLRSDAALALMRVSDQCDRAICTRGFFAAVIRRAFRHRLSRTFGKRAPPAATVAVDELVAVGIEPPSREADPGFLAALGESREYRVAMARKHRGRPPGSGKRGR